MKVKGISFLIALALVVLASGVAFAEPLEGEVASVDLTGNTLEITKAADPATGAAESVKVSVNDTTTYSGEVTALAEVIEGDKVKLEVEKDATTGNMVAKSVDVAAIPE